MGDRGNVVLEQEGKEIFLYSHWGGTEIPGIVQRVIAKRIRWDDDAYLGRLIFQEMTRGCEDEETGFGISTYAPDNEYPYIRVNSDKQAVTVDFSPVGQRHPNKSYSFEEFASMKGVDWEALKNKVVK
jgi:hypothetical protein